MGILNRFSEIMKANINDLLDKCEDPAKMIDQSLRTAKEDLAEVKSSTAKVMADEKSAQRVYDASKAKVEKEHALAIAALQSGNEGDAKKFLASEEKLKAQLAVDEKTLNAAKENSRKMKEMYNKLTADIQDMESRRNSIKATMAVADATEKVNKLKTPSRDAVSSFEKYENMAQRMLDEAQSKIELSEQPVDEMDSLRSKYSVSDINVDAQLESLKKECGLE